MSPPEAEPSLARATGTTQPAEHDQASPHGANGSGGSGELIMDLGALVITAGLVGVIVLVRRWLMLRSHKPLPGLPRERVLPLSRHDKLHDPKYLGRILEDEEPPAGP